MTENDWKLEEIEAEIRAQIEFAIKKIPHISHVTSHMGWTSMDPRVTDLVKKLTAEYGIDIIPEELGVQRARYEGEKKTEKEKLKSFSKMLRNLEKGKTYLFVDHPAIDRAEQQAVNHIGYEDVAGDRNGVLKVWTDPKIKKLVQELGIELISYKDLIRKLN